MRALNLRSPAKARAGRSFLPMLGLLAALATQMVFQPEAYAQAPSFEWVRTAGSCQAW